MFGNSPRGFFKQSVMWKTYYHTKTKGEEDQTPLLMDGTEKKQNQCNHVYCLNMAIDPKMWWMKWKTARFYNTILHYNNSDMFSITVVLGYPSVSKSLCFSDIYEAYFSFHHGTRVYTHVWLVLTQGGWWEQLKGVYETVRLERMLPCSFHPNKRVIYYIQHDPLITHK